MNIERKEYNIFKSREVHYLFHQIQQRLCNLNSTDREIETFFKDMNTAEKLYAMVVLNDESVVTNLKGEWEKRHIRVNISRVSQFPGGEKIFADCCKALADKLAEILLDHPLFMGNGNQIIFPNIVFALGGSDRMAPIIVKAISENCGIGKASGDLMPWFRLARQLDERNEVMTGFDFSKRDRDHGIDFRSGSAFAVLIDDSDFTLRSQYLASRFLSKIKINIIASLVLFDQYGGKKWPAKLDKIPIKIALTHII